MKKEKKRVDFDRVRRSVPLTAILQRYNFLADLKPSGAQLKGRCPIHDGDKKARSFVVDPGKNVWHCFSPSCAKGGGTLEFVAAFEKVEIRDAALLIANWFAIKSDTARKQQPQRRRK